VLDFRYLKSKSDFKTRQVSSSCGHLIRTRHQWRKATECFKLNLNLPKTETSSRSSSGFPRDSNGLPKVARSTAEGFEATVRGDEYSNRALHRESKEEIHAFDNEPSGLTADDHDLLSCSSQSLQWPTHPVTVIRCRHGEKLV